MDAFCLSSHGISILSFFLELYIMPIFLCLFRLTGYISDCMLCEYLYWCTFAQQSLVL